MLEETFIKKILSKLDLSLVINIKQMQKEFGGIHQIDDYGRSLLHIFVDNKYDETKCFLAIKSLLWAGLNPNLEDNVKYNFIQTALYTGYSEDFIIKIINEALKYKLDVNHVDSDKDTMVHTAIYSDDYVGGIIGIYDLLCDNGFDSKKVDCDGKTLIDAIVFQKQYSKEEIMQFFEMFLKEVNKKEKKHLQKVLKKNRCKK